jgi:high-affinity Fe2+/Pb2+ permease
MVVLYVAIAVGAVVAVVAGVFIFRYVRKRRAGYVALK